MKTCLAIFAALCASAASAYKVHSIEQTQVDGTATVIRDIVLDAGESYLTTTAPSVSGHIFTHWSTEPGFEFDLQDRDVWNRAYDAAIITPYEDMTSTANYLGEAIDADGDGIADGYEIYWYGDLGIGPDSDTDDDGYTFEEEVSAGTNPIFHDRHASGSGMAIADVIWYNPSNYWNITIRSEVAGFEAGATEIRKAGTTIELPVIDSSGDTRWHWQANGEWIDAEWNSDFSAIYYRVPAHDVELVAMRVPPEDDQDGDGYPNELEENAGTNPIFFDKHVPGGVAMSTGTTVEVDLQPFEQLRGAVVDGEYEELFTSQYAGNEATSAVFGENSAPLSVDVDGDGLNDLVVFYKGGIVVFGNVGSATSPELRRLSGGVWHSLAANIASMTKPRAAGGSGVIYVSDGGGEIARFLVSDGTWIYTGVTGIPAVLDGELIALRSNGRVYRADGTQLSGISVASGISMTCADVDGDGKNDILVSDSYGRIWYYHQESDGTFKLKYRVYGGTGIGFAEGLTISAVDWDGDGDYDLVTGRTDGRLMLLRDPDIGRPTGLRATVGATSVVLDWDPDRQSRVRGYNVYRAPEENSYGRIADGIGVPRYRDVPEVLKDYWYRVTALSRFYITGNTTPTVNESMPSEAVFVSFGSVDVWLNDTSSFTETNVEVVVSMNNSMGLSSDGFSMTFAYDPAVLEPVEMKRTGLTKDLEFAPPSANAGVWTLSATGGEIGIGAGEFLRLKFYVKPVHDVTETTVTLTTANVKSAAGQSVSLELPKSAKIDISDANPLQSALVSLSLGNAAVNTGEAFNLPFTITSSEVLTSGVFTVTYDDAMLELTGVEGGELRRAGSSAPCRVEATGSGRLLFMARELHSVQTNFSTVVIASSFAAVDCNGFEVMADDAQGEILIKNAHPIFPAVVSVSTEDRKVDTLEEVTVPFNVMSSEALASGSFTVEWDSAVLDLAGTDGTAGTDGHEVVSATGNFSLTFLAKDQHEISKTLVRLTAATVTDVNGFTVCPTVPVISTILIHDAFPLVPAEVAVKAGTVSADTRATFEVPVTVTSSKVLTNFCVTVGWDEDVLEWRGVEGAKLRTVSGAHQDSNSAILAANGDVPSVITLIFYAKDQHTAKETTVALSAASAYCTDGLAANVATENGRVLLTDSNPPVAVNMVIATLDARAESGKAFVVPLGATTDGDLAELTATIEWDVGLLTFDGAEGSAVVSSAASSVTLDFSASGTHNLFDLGFTAKKISGLRTNATVRVTAAGGTGANGLAANVTTKLPVESTVLIVRSIGKYDPGDINGDGKYTDADMTMLQNYIKYQSIVSVAPQLASRYASWNLSGKALKAADVNEDSRVDANDVSTLAQLIASWKEANP